MEDSGSSLGGLVIRLRQRARLSQEELAERAGLSVRAVRNIERGVVGRPHRDTVTLLAQALQLDDDRTDQLFDLAGMRVELPAGPPPPPEPEPGPVRPAQLPADVPAFTGREEYLAELDGLLDGETPAVLVSAVAGMAGVGKTALAVRWAHRVRDRFPDGQLFVDLRGYASAAPLRAVDALARFLRALGIPAERIPADEDEAAAMYRSLLADRRMLVLLDNARSPRQVRPLLPGGAHCLVVVTSRDQLTGLVARDGAHRLSLDALDQAQARELLARVLGADRVRAEPAAADELARACARLPLALRIAAAKLGARPRQRIAEYVAGLCAGDRLTDLSVDGDEQSGVRAAFDLSYRALPDAARRLFRLIGLVPGPDVDAPAAAALAGTAPAAAAGLLDRLAAGHLVGCAAPGRYAPHDLLRRYAVELAERHDDPEAREAARGRLCDHYLSTVDAAARLLYPHILRLPGTGTGPAAGDFDSHEAALAWLDAERANLVAAVTHAAEHGPAGAAYRLADALRGYFWLRLDGVDWETVARAGLAAARADRNLPAQAAAHTNLATLRWLRGDQSSSVRHHSRALALSRSAGWTAGQGTALNNLGNAYRLAGRARRAAEYLTEALDLNRVTGRVGGRAANVANLGTVYAELGRLDAAARRLGEALELFRDVGSRVGEANALGMLATVHHLLGRFDAGLDEAGRALLLHREHGDRHGESEAMCTLAEIHRDAGRLAEAMTAARGGLTLADEVGNGRARANLNNVLAELHDRLGDHGTALDRRGRAERLAREAGDRYGEAVVRTGLASTHRQLGDTSAALRRVTDALDLSRECGYRVVEGQASAVAAAIHLDRADPALAVRNAERALALHRETGHQFGRAHAHLLLARLADDPAGAERHRREAHAILARTGVRQAAPVP